jgi:hypothetical protein
MVIMGLKSLLKRLGFFKNKDVKPTVIESLVKPESPNAENKKDDQVIAGQVIEVVKSEETKVIEARFAEVAKEKESKVKEKSEITAREIKAKSKKDQIPDDKTTQKPAVKKSPRSQKPTDKKG